MLDVFTLILNHLKIGSFGNLHLWGSIYTLEFTRIAAYIYRMKKKSLFDSNPHLHDPKKYHAALITSVSSSTAIETGNSIESISKQITDVASNHPHTIPLKPGSNSR